MPGGTESRTNSAGKDNSAGPTLPPKTDAPSLRRISALLRPTLILAFLVFARQRAPAADPIRVALGGGKAWVPSTGKRGGPGTAIDVPLAHKDALYVRSHYDSFSVTFGDGPAPDEVIIIWAFATRGRLHARLGGLQASDIKGDNGLT